MRAVALLACIAFVTGCFGYNQGAKRWAYVGDTMLVLGGAAAVTADVLTSEEPCVGTGCPTFTLPFGGAAVAGTFLLAAGIVGYVINATRPTLKSSH
jgi:hypothetical protein